MDKFYMFLLVVPMYTAFSLLYGFRNKLFGGNEGYPDKMFHAYAFMVWAYVFTYLAYCNM